MRNNTQRIYERLSRGEFLSVDSADASVRHLYEDIEENLEDYTEYFKEIGLQLESDNGYFYFSRIGEGKQTIEQKLDSFSKWLDYLDFLDIELKEKANRLFKKYGVGSNVEIVNKLLQEMQNMGFAECISELDETFKVTSAFRYVEELVEIIQIANEDEIPE